MGLFEWIVFGFVVGLLARALETGPSRMGFGASVSLGISGAMVGGLVARLLGGFDTDSGAGMIAAVVGAIIFLAVYKASLVREERRKAMLTENTRDRTDRFAA